jgi:hypothetical protein
LRGLRLFCRKNCAIQLVSSPLNWNDLILIDNVYSVVLMWVKEDTFVKKLTQCKVFSLETLSFKLKMFTMQCCHWTWKRVNPLHSVELHCLWTKKLPWEVVFPPYHWHSRNILACFRKLHLRLLQYESQDQPWPQISQISPRHKKIWHKNSYQRCHWQHTVEIKLCDRMTKDKSSRDSIP